MNDKRLAEIEAKVNCETKVDDCYLGFCCKGYDWVVISIDTNGGIWGACKNPECPDEPNNSSGVSPTTQEDLAEWLVGFEL